MRKIILLLFLFILISSKKFLEQEILSEDFNDNIVLKKAGFGGIHRSISIPKPVAPKPSLPRSTSFKTKRTPVSKCPTLVKIMPPSIKTKPNPIRVNPTLIKVKHTPVKLKPTIIKNPGVNLESKLTKNPGKTPVSTKISKPESIFKGKFQLPNPLNNKNEIKIGKKGKISIENDYHNINVDGSVTRTKKLTPGITQDTTYKGGVGVKLDGDTKGISVSGGKTTKKTEEINYQTHGTEHKVSIEGINKDGNKKIEGSYTNKKTDGKGVKVGKVNVSNTNTKEKKYTLGGGIDKDERKHIKGAYETKDTNTKKIKVGKIMKFQKVNIPEIHRKILVESKKIKKILLLMVYTKING